MQKVKFAFHCLSGSAITASQSWTSRDTLFCFVSFCLLFFPHLGRELPICQPAEWRIKISSCRRDLMKTNTHTHKDGMRLWSDQIPAKRPLVSPQLRFRRLLANQSQPDFGDCCCSCFNFVVVSLHRSRSLCFCVDDDDDADRLSVGTFSRRLRSVVQSMQQVLLFVGVPFKWQRARNQRSINFMDEKEDLSTAATSSVGQQQQASYALGCQANGTAAQVGRPSRSGCCCCCSGRKKR